jgi:hypothetical protein
MKRYVAIGMLIAGAGSWYWPGFNGVFSAPADITTGDGRIIGAILLVGAAILWFMPSPPSRE